MFKEAVVRSCTEYADRLKNAFPNFKTAFLPEYASFPSTFVPQQRDRASEVGNHHCAWLRNWKKASFGKDFVF